MHVGAVTDLALSTTVHPPERLEPARLAIHAITVDGVPRDAMVWVRP